MRLNSLRMKNFRQHADSRIDFESGLTGIIGPNGAGKSTILVAIAYALYGTAAVKGDAKSIRWLRAKPRTTAQVELDFDLGPHRYRVVRGEHTAELFLDGDAAPIANGHTSVTDVLRQRLQMTRYEFFNTYFTGQKELTVMAAMKPAAREMFLSRVLRHERLTAARELIRERRNAVSARAKGLEAGMDDPEAIRASLREAEENLARAEVRQREAAERLERATRAYAEAEPRWDAVRREREQVQQLLIDLGRAESDEAAAARELKRLSGELRDLVAAREELERLATDLTPFADVVTQLQRMDSLCRDEGRRQALLDNHRALVEEISRLSERRAKVDGAEGWERSATQELEQLRAVAGTAEAEYDGKHTEWVRDRQEAETKLRALREQFAELREQHDRLAELGESGACPTCTRPLGAQFRPVLEDLEAKLETIRVDGGYYKARVEQLETPPEELAALDERRRQLSEQVTELERRLTRIQHAVSDLAQLTKDIAAKQQRIAQIARELAAIPSGYDKARHDALQAELRRLTPLSTRATQLTERLKDHDRIHGEYLRATQRGGEIADRIQRLRDRRDALASAEQRYAEVSAEYEERVRERDSAKHAATETRLQAEFARRECEMARRRDQELAKKEEQLTALNKERRLHDELDQAFTDIRADLNAQLRPALSEIASNLLIDLTDARYSGLDLDAEYNINLLEDNIPKPVISGGEEDLANLVLRLAISQMIADRTGQNFTLLILDEVFGSLDEARRNNVVDLLRRLLLQNRFEQIVVITHIESVREGLDHVISVQYDEESGSSVVRQASPISPVVLPPGEAGDLFEDAAEIAPAEQA